MSFFLGSWGMNRSAEQTNRPRTASRFTRFVCPALRFIPHEPRKKDTHSLNDELDLPYIVLDSKDAQNHYYKHRFIARSSKCSTKPLSFLLTKLLTHYARSPEVH